MSNERPGLPFWKTRFTLAAVFVLIAVLVLAVILVIALVLIIVLVAVLILIVVLALVLILVIHSHFLQIFLADNRNDRLPRFSGFILGTEKNAGEQSGQHGCRDSTGGCLQATCKYSNKSFLRDRFLNAFR